MANNTKLLVLCSLFIIMVGSVLLLFGLNPDSNDYTPGVSTVVKQEVHTGSENLNPEYVADEQEFSESGIDSDLIGVDGERAYVTKVVDGDTIIVDINGEKHTIRILGVDTPETVDPRKSVQCFGKEASNETKKLLSGKEVILQKDVSDTDKYKRLLRFVYLPLEDGNYLFIDDYLIREGYAKVLTIPPDVKYGEQFLDAQREARLEKRGLWGRC